MDNSYIYTRPERQTIPYGNEINYSAHLATEDSLAILVCQIKIWRAKSPDWFAKPDPDGCLIVRECESIEVTDSAKDLLGKAVVKFPRGTVIQLRKRKDKKVVTGEESEGTETTATVEASTNNGEVTTPQTSVYEDGTPTASIAANYDDKGLVDFNRTKTEAALLTPNDVAIGNRIEIRLGYAYSETEFDKMNAEVDSKEMEIVFTGFITSISVDTPLELGCTNMAHILSSVSVPTIKAQDMITVSDFLDSDGAYRLLEGTGIELDDACRKSQIYVRGGSITNNLSVADVLADWSKGGVLSRMVTQSDGSVRLKVGLSYNAGASSATALKSDKKYITYNGGGNMVPLIQSDWDVAGDKLTMKRCDKKYLAVKAFGRSDGKLFQLVVRKNPDDDDEGWVVDKGDQFEVVNKQKPYSRKKEKRKKSDKKNPYKKEKPRDHVSLDKYNVVPYYSTAKKITEQGLIEEAKRYWSQYTPNGIDGSLEIFGDVFVSPTDTIALIDKRQPQKNGYYYVESVNTTFGLNGFRRELKIPYKIASFKKVTEI